MERCGRGWNLRHRIRKVAKDLLVFFNMADVLLFVR